MARKKSSPRKPVWPIGATRIVSSSDGETRVINPSVHHHGSKEEIELFFAKLFIEKFNAILPLGAKRRITIKKQNDTSNLDFSISCGDLEFLELAEASPYDADFGKTMLETGSVDVYEFSKWIWTKTIQNKAKKYGKKAERTLLLVYSSRREFLIHSDTIACLQSTMHHKGCQFGAIFILLTDGDELIEIPQIYPLESTTFPPPRMFRGRKILNLNLDKATVHDGYISLRIKLDLSGQL